MNRFSAVSLTPAINFRLFGYFWPVSLTLGKNVFAGVNDTAKKLFTGVNKPAINCLPVSTTPPINFSGNNKLYWWQRFVLSAKLSPAAEVGHGRRYCHWNSHEKAQRHLTHPDQALEAASYIKPKPHYLVLAASGATDQDMWDVYGCNFSWRFQWHHGGHGQLRRLEIAPIYPLQLFPILSSSPPYRRCCCHRW